MFIYNFLLSAASESQFLIKDLLYILNGSLNESLSVDDDKGTLTASVHAAGTPERHLVIEVIFLQVLFNELYNIPVPSRETGTAEAYLYLI
jgi:hypothetical protein